MGFSLLEYLRKNNWILSCPKCKRKLYKVDEPSNDGIDVIVEARFFHPLADDIPQPQPNQRAECPFCEAILIYDSKIRSNGK